MTEPLEIDVHGVKFLLDNSADVVLLDCREEAEVNTVQIEGSHWLPMSEIQSRVAELDVFRVREIVVYCHLGARSLQVANWLRSQGFRSAKSMAGGVDAWAIEIDPGLPRY